VNGLPAIARMRNKILGYDWGSTTALARLQNRSPSGGPEAELWMGAHPAAPSELLVTDESTEGHSLQPLGELLARSPQALLGAQTVLRFGPRLPYLLKVLAIARPLSLQVHPDAARARAIYQPGGGSPYVDPFHKPEMLYALEATEALFGFRTAGTAAMLLGRLGCERLTGLVKTLGGDGVAGSDPREADAALLHEALATLLTWPMSDRAALVAEIASASGRLKADGNTDYAEAYGWLDRLVGLHPADPMVLAPLLLDVVRLPPGATLFVPAGVPHSYLSGLGVEILAASDNVLRSGLTSKRIDVAELLKVIDCRPITQHGVAQTALGGHEVAWRPAVEDFQLSRIRIQDDEPDVVEVAADPSITGPQIVLCTRGAVQLRTSTGTVELTSGDSAFVSASAGPLTLHRAQPDTGFEAFRAAVGRL
jgi:mannose-6-phosphate isomerase